MTDADDTGERAHWPSNVHEGRLEGIARSTSFLTGSVSHDDYSVDCVSSGSTRGIVIGIESELLVRDERARALFYRLSLRRRPRMQAGQQRGSGLLSGSVLLDAAQAAKLISFVGAPSCVRH